MSKIPLAVLLTDQRQRWLHGDRVLVEAYVAQQPSLKDRSDGLLDLIYHEVLLREERGETVSVAEFLQRFPDLAEELRLQFEVHLDLSRDDLTDGQPAKKPRRRLPRIPGYGVLSRLGSGGVGVVYKAKQLGLDRLVAIKVLQSGSGATPTDRARFRREAEAVARLNHPQVVQVYEVGERNGCPYLVLEYADSGGLDRVLAHQIPSPQVVARMMSVLARTMHVVHGQGIVHCDLKPANILLSRTNAMEGLPLEVGPDRTGHFDFKVTDFGFARRLESEHHSQSGQALGTLHYMAPEQLDGHSRDIGPPADIHALGAICYELLTGRPPFLGADLPQVLLQVRFEEPVFPRQIQSSVPRDLETICLKCLNKDPQLRYRTAADLADDLERFLTGRPILARPVSTLERCWRWSRRNRSLAAALAAACVFLVLGTTLSTSFAIVASQQRTSAETARGNERTARLSAEAANRQLSQALYFDRIARVNLERQSGNIVRARELLSSCLPGSGEPDLRGWEWHFLNRRCHQERLILEAPLKGLVYHVAYSPDGDLLAAGDETGQVAVWNASDGTLRHTFKEHHSSVIHLSFSTDGKWLVSGERKGTVIVRSAGEGSEHVRLDVTEGSALKGTFLMPPSFQIALDFQTDRLAVALSKSLALESGVELSTWDLSSRRRLHSRLITGAESVTLSPRGNCVAVRQTDGRTQLLAIDSDTELPPLRDSSTIAYLVFSPDGQFALADLGNQRKVWDVATGSVLFTSSDHPSGLHDLALSTDGRTAVSLLPGGRELRVWETQTGLERGRFLGHSSGAVHSAVLRPQSSEFASAGGLITESGDVRVWPLSRATESRALPHKTEGAKIAWGWAFSADDRWFAVATGGLGDEPGVVELFDAQQRSVVKQLQVDGTNFRTVALGEKVLAAGSDNGSVAVWSWPQGEQQAQLSVGGQAQTVSGLALSADGQLLATACDTHVGPTPSEIQVRSLPDGQLKFRLTAHVGTSPVLAFHPDGRFLVSGGGMFDRSLRIWDMADGREIRVLRAHAKAICGITFSRDGQRLVTASEDGVIKLWHGISGTEILTLTAPRSNSATISFRANGELLIGGNQRGEVFVWDGSPQMLSPVSR